MRHTEQNEKKPMGILSAASIGVGAMIGAGIFALVGIAVDLAGELAYLSFIIAGVITLFCSYSVARLAAVFPAKGGMVTYINAAFGSGVVSGGLNIAMWLGYIIVCALYARAFGEYGAALAGLEHSAWLKNLLGSSIVAIFIGINFAGAAAVGTSELFIVGAKVAILLLFGLLGLVAADPQGFMPSQQSGLHDIVIAAGILFMSYEGFGLVANTAEDIRDPEKNLPIALFLSVGIAMAIYVLVTLSVVGNLSLEEIERSKEYVLAEAAKPIMGKIGFTIIGVAAILSTASAINATIYGPVNMVQQTAKARQLPPVFNRKLLGRQSGSSLLITGILVIIIANSFSLDAIAELGSLVFLMVYTATNAANLKLRNDTHTLRWPVYTAILGTIFCFVVLVFHVVDKNPLLAIIFAAGMALCFLYEWYRQQKIRGEE